MRIGIGYDSHRLVAGRKLIIGGREIPFEKGLLGHSDADVLCHALIDAILGALGVGDIGQHFPDSDSTWKDASSLELLAETIVIMKEKGFDVLWVDSVVITEKPPLRPYIQDMKQNMARAGISIDSISIKAKTNEGMGYIGAGEGMAAHAVCLLKPL